VIIWGHAEKKEGFAPCVSVVSLSFFSRTVLLLYGGFLEDIDMTIEQVARILEAEIVSAKSGGSREVFSACGSDMMSDVMAFFHGEGILLTGLVNAQTIRTANLMDIPCVCLVRGKKATPDMTAMADEFAITVMETKYPMFAACGLLYAAGLAGAQEDA
jgi:predicted transcriptional regulator